MQAPNRLQHPSGLLSELLGRARHDETAVASQPDTVLTRFFQNQAESVMAFAAECDVLEVVPLALNRYRVTFSCHTLLQTPEGVKRRPAEVTSEIWLSRNYLRHVESMQVISILDPSNLFLANVRPPYCCIGEIKPGTPLTDLVWRLWEVLAGLNFMPDERDALNQTACSWIRNHPERFPLDTRPLKRSSHPAQGPHDETADGAARRTANGAANQAAEAAEADGTDGTGWEIV